MGRLDREARNAMAVLLERGHTKSDVALARIGMHW